jgi:hypothetical protein
MKCLLLFVVLSLNFVKAENPKNTDKTFFPNAKKDIEIILGHKVFSSYQEYNITNVHQGEMGESMAYFVSLEKPFETSPVRLCFIFMSKGGQNWNMHGSVNQCKDKDLCACK